AEQEGGGGDASLYDLRGWRSRCWATGSSNGLVREEVTRAPYDVRHDERRSRQSNLGGTMRGRQLVPAMGLGILLAACSGPASESSLSPTTSRSVAPADLVAVAKRTFPLIPQFGYYAVCGSDGNTSRCPYTARLKA